MNTMNTNGVGLVALAVGFLSVGCGTEQPIDGGTGGTLFLQTTPPPAAKQTRTTARRILCRMSEQPSTTASNSDRTVASRGAPAATNDEGRYSTYLTEE